MRVKKVVIEKVGFKRIMVPITQDPGYVAAQEFINNSVTLKDKKVVGRFVCFDSKDHKHETMIVLDEQKKRQKILISKVITVLDKWVIADL